MVWSKTSILAWLGYRGLLGLSAVSIHSDYHAPVLRAGYIILFSFVVLVRDHQLAGQY